MVNAEKGEVTVDIGGTSYTLKHSMNASIEVEALLSKTEGRRVRWSEVIAELNAGSLSAKRAVFWAMLHTHHPSVTLEQAGLLSDQLDLQQALSQAVAVGAPAAEDLQELSQGATGRPRKARASRRAKVNGTGDPSTSAAGQAV